jgi:hypothetical protein
MRRLGAPPKQEDSPRAPICRKPGVTIEALKLQLPLPDQLKEIELN